LGYEVGPHGVDGIYGPDTARAVKRFQEEVFVDPIEWDKIVGPKTYGELYNVVKEIAIDNELDVDEIIDLTDDEGNYEEEIEYQEFDDEHDHIPDEDYADEYDEESDESLNIPDEYLKDDDLADKIIDKASEQIGQTYNIGCEFDTEGEREGGDCSGLIDWTFRHLPEVNSDGRETTRSLERSPGFIRGKNNWDEVEKGDILLFDKRVGGKYGHTGFVYSVGEDGKIDMIHSAISGWDEGTKKGTQITRDIFNKYDYWRKQYLGYIPYEYFKVSEEIT
jgi:cell wall-associated NlpC family hydrolase